MSSTNEDEKTRLIYRERLGNLLPEMPEDIRFVPVDEKSIDKLSERERLARQDILFKKNSQLVDLFKNTKSTYKTVDDILKMEMSTLRAKHSQFKMQLREAMENDPLSPECIDVGTGTRQFLRLKTKTNQLRTLSAKRMKETLQTLNESDLHKAVDDLL